MVERHSDDSPLVAKDLGLDITVQFDHGAFDSPDDVVSPSVGCSGDDTVAAPLFQRFRRFGQTAGNDGEVPFVPLVRVTRGAGQQIAPVTGRGFDQKENALFPKLRLGGFAGREL